MNHAQKMNELVLDAELKRIKNMEHLNTLQDKIRKLYKNDTLYITIFKGHISIYHKAQYGEDFHIIRINLSKLTFQIFDSSYGYRLSFISDLLDMVEHYTIKIKYKLNQPSTEEHKERVELNEKIRDSLEDKG